MRSFPTDSFLGAVDENNVAEPIVYPAANNNGNFGLDHYEPGFAVSRGSWLENRDAGTGLKNNVRLTITDTTSPADLFYFWSASRTRFLSRIAAAV